jgi:hypothetical protein
MTPILFRVCEIPQLSRTAHLVHELIGEVNLTFHGEVADSPLLKNFIYTAQVLTSVFPSHKNSILRTIMYPPTHHPPTHTIPLRVRSLDCKTITNNILLKPSF